jgi:hypothetical protein
MSCPHNVHRENQRYLDILKYIFPTASFNLKKGPDGCETRKSETISLLPFPLLTKGSLPFLNHLLAVC